MWPFRRRARGAEEVSPSDAGPVLRAPRQDWKGLAPMPTVQSRPLATVDTGFEQRLATRQAPTFLGPLGHHLAPEAPHGRVAAAPASRQPVTFPSAPPVQRQVMTDAQPPDTPSPPASPPVAADSPPRAISQLLMENEQVFRFSSRVGENAATDAPVRAAPVVSRLVTARPPADLPATAFPVVARLPADDPSPAAHAGEPASGATAEAPGAVAEPPAATAEAPRAVAETPPAPAGDAVASLVGDKAPMTSLAEPDAPPVGPSPEAPQPGRPVQREFRPAPAAQPAGRTAVSPSHAEPLARAGTQAPPSTKQSAVSPRPTVARTLDPTGPPRPRMAPRIGPPIQRSADPDSAPAPAAGGTPPPLPDLGPPTPAEPSGAAAEVAADEPPEPSIESAPLVGDRGLSGPPTFASVPGPTVARSHLPGGPAMTPGPAVTAPRAVSWRPRVGEPVPPVALGSTPAAASPSVAGRPTVSRHAAGGPVPHHAADEWPEKGPVSRLADGRAQRLPATPAVTSAPDAGTATRQETTVAGIRWSDRPAPVAQTWTAAAVQRSPATPSTTPWTTPSTTTSTTTASLARRSSPGAPTTPISQLLMQNESSVRFPSRVGTETWWELPGAEEVVQRQADDAPAAAEPAPAPTTVTATAETGPAAPAGASAGGRKAPTEAEADEWARALYPALRRRICRDLMLDRERSGYSTDIRY